jgi:hypothetical protein
MALGGASFGGSSAGQRDPAEGAQVASNSNDSGAARASRLAKAAQDGAAARAQYEADARSVRAKTARLRELRLAKEAAEPKPAPAPARKAAKSKKKPVPLADYLDGRQKSGHDG